MSKTLSVVLFLLTSILFLFGCGKRAAEAEAPLNPYSAPPSVGFKMLVEDDGVTSELTQVDLVPMAIQDSAFASKPTSTHRSYQKVAATF